MTNAETLIERAAARSASLADRVRGICMYHELAVQHELISKAAVDPVDTGLSAQPGYWQLLQEVEARAALTRIGAVEVPFATRVAAITTAPQAHWVAAHGAKPVTKAGITPVTLAPTKLAALMPVTNELLRASGDRADRALQRALRDAAVAALNAALLSDDPGTPDESPAGLGDGLASTPSSGLTDAAILEDIVELVDGMREPTLIGPLGLVLRARAALRGADDLPIVVAPQASNRLFAVDAGAVVFAGPAIDVASSKHASVVMSDTPDSPAAMVSMWQTNSTVLRVDVLVNWTVVRPDGVRALNFAGN
jgi:hypothetical protein